MVPSVDKFIESESRTVTARGWNERVRGVG
jgi:hypothetical protein